MDLTMGFSVHNIVGACSVHDVMYWKYAGAGGKPPVCKNGLFSDCIIVTIMQSENKPLKQIIPLQRHCSGCLCSG